jgi:hypothetical protein
MSWVVPVLFRIAAAYLVVPLLVKPLVDMYPQRTLILLQFAGCFVLALLVRTPLRLYVYAGAYSLLLGGSVFFMRHLVQHQLLFDG